MLVISNHGLKPVVIHYKCFINSKFCKLSIATGFSPWMTNSITCWALAQIVYEVVFLSNIIFVLK